MAAKRERSGKAPVTLTGAGSRIAVLSVHTSPLSRLGGYAAGGMNVYVRATAQQLGRRGYLVDIFTRDDGSQAPLVALDRGVRLLSLPVGPREPLSKEQSAEFLPAFLEAMQQFRQRNNLDYDILHSHYWQAGWVASRLAPSWGIPHVATFHTLGEVKNRAHFSEHETERRIESERAIAQSADRVICFGEHERHVLTGFYQVPAERIAVIPAGVDLRRFHPLDQNSARQTLGLGSAPLVLYVGRLEPLKGVDILIQAMAQLERRDARLLIVGGDEQAAVEIDRLRSLAASLEIAERIDFLGAVDQTELPQYYSAADVCVMPSYYESFGLVAVEAMACGTPVIASRVGGLATTVEDGETGYLIPWRCPEPFAERIDLILGNDELRRNLGQAARQAMQRFSWQHVSRELAAEYARIWSERAAGPAGQGAALSDRAHSAHGSS